MAHPSKRKGDKAELEAAKLLTNHLGFDIVRALGAGRAEDTGDLWGLPSMTIQVKNYRNITTAVNDGLEGATRQQANAGTPFGAAMIRRPGRNNWFIAMTVEQFCALYREAL